MISGQKEIFRKRYIVDRTNKVELRPEEQSERAEGKETLGFTSTETIGAY